MTMNTSRRYALYAGVAAAAGLTGVGVAWHRHQLAEVSKEALDGLWGAEFQTPTQDTLHLKAFQGKSLVLNFWATWCPPCVEEMPLLDRFFRENSAKEWQVLGLAIDQPSQVRKFLGQFPVSYPIGLAGLGGTELSKSLGNPEGGLPFTVVLDAQGQLKQRKIGKLTEDDVKNWA
ncbi:redoxin [Limnohabitans sp. JirII-29]|uniref:TlpA disulfide reductase family protein n=1 Tax=Limnohabitans sp. JirII-29 TaxID=1835756 RepID=UPI000D36C0D1|nr:TlpA disulfide reductase family protein [Limnohabitans sp. JirII-29]PUE29298.1 redoxin [Limnohabitans sp. JirII-29]